MAERMRDKRLDAYTHCMLGSDDELQDLNSPIPSSLYVPSRGVCTLKIGQSRYTPSFITLLTQWCLLWCVLDIRVRMKVP